LVFGICFLPTASFGDDYYVARNGRDNSTCSIDAPCATFAHAADLLQPGDTLFVRGGTYREVLEPPSSGTGHDRMITYTSYPGEVVEISNVTDPIRISNESWIRINGFRFVDIDDFGYISNGHHNEIANSTFGPMRNYVAFTGFSLSNGASYNWVHHCTFSIYGYYSSTSDFGDMFTITSDTGASRYNLVENNTMFYSGHEVIRITSSYNVVRNNYFHNEGRDFASGDSNRSLAGSSSYGNRNMEIVDHRPSASGGEFNLIEGNRFGATGDPPDSDHSPGIQLASPNNIVRYNVFYDSYGPGLKFSTWNSEDTNASGNRVYNNTFYRNGFTEASGYFNCAVCFMEVGDAILGNVVKNNIFWQNNADGVRYVSTQRPIGELQADNTVVSNLRGDPSFRDAGPLIDPFDPSFPDFRLRPGSIAIDAGAALTVTTTSGRNSTSLDVEDANYFSDGFSGVVHPDWIVVGRVEPVRIEAVSRSTNRITLSEPRTWNAVDPVYLYRRSTGEIVYFGGGPDFGAHEFDPGDPGDPPER
jgi:parallel beta-helix repeat protein